MKKILLISGQQISSKVIENIYKSFYGSNVDEYIHLVYSTLKDLNDLTLYNSSFWNELLEKSDEYFCIFTFGKNLSYTVVNK